MSNLNEKAVKANDNKILFNQFIKKYNNMLLALGSKSLGRFVTIHDEEYSTMLFAFTRAIKTYNMDKGDFYGYAKLLVDRSLIDFKKSKRANKNHENIDDIDESEINIDFSVNNLELEILQLKNILYDYGYNYSDLEKNSPKAKKTKKICAKIISFILANSEISSYIKEKKRIPMKKIVEKLKMPPKKIERHRIYIIAAVEILSGDFQYISEYLQYIKEEN